VCIGNICRSPMAERLLVCAARELVEALGKVPVLVDIWWASTSPRGRGMASRAPNRCSYTIERVDGYRMGPDDIQPIGDGQRLDPDVGVTTSFRLWDGDTLELSGPDLL
jgi:Low molecular weight phosphotyrosine protein phosphatase